MTTHATTITRAHTTGGNQGITTRQTTLGEWIGQPGGSQHEYIQQKEKNQNKKKISKLIRQRRKRT